MPLPEGQPTQRQFSEEDLVSPPYAKIPGWNPNIPGAAPEPVDYSQYRSPEGITPDHVAPVIDDKDPTEAQRRMYGPPESIAAAEKSEVIAPSTRVVEHKGRVPVPARNPARYVLSTINKG